MRLIAIDPGPTKSAWVMWDTQTHYFYGWKMGDDFEAVAHILADCPNPLPEMVAIEFPQSYGRTVGLSVLGTCYEAGRIAQMVVPIPVRLIGRPSIKGVIGGRTDAEIRASLRMRFGEAKKGHPLEGVKNDIWAALALAVAVDEYPGIRRVIW